MKRYDRTSALRAELAGLAIAGRVKDLRTPVPVGVFDNERIVLFQRLRGRSLSDVLGSCDPATAKSAATRIGTLLRRVHETPEDQSRALPDQLLEELMSSELEQLMTHVFIEELHEKLFEFRGEGWWRDIKFGLESPEGFGELVGRVVDSVERHQAWPEERRFVHGDLWSGNILLARDRGRCSIAFIDFESCMRSSTIVDVARVFSRGLTPRAPHIPYRLSPEKSLWESFLSGYGKGEHEVMGDGVLGTAVTYATVRTINHYFRLSCAPRAKRAERAFRVGAVLRIARALNSFLRCESEGKGVWGGN